MNFVTLRRTVPNLGTAHAEHGCHTKKHSGIFWIHDSSSDSRTSKQSVVCRGVRRRTFFQAVRTDSTQTAEKMISNQLAWVPRLRWAHTSSNKNQVVVVSQNFENRHHDSDKPHILVVALPFSQHEDEAELHLYIPD